MPPSKRPSHLDKYQNNQLQTQLKQNALEGFHIPHGRTMPQDHRPSMVLRNGLNPQQPQNNPRQRQSVTPGMMARSAPNHGLSGSEARQGMAAKRQSILNVQGQQQQQHATRSNGIVRPSSSSPSSSSSSSPRTRPASQYHGHPMRTTVPCIFDLFFDLPHPGASRDAARARMVAPPGVSNPAIAAELHDPSALSRLARFAFPEHDDHKHGACRVVSCRYSAYFGSSVDYIFVVVVVFKVPTETLLNNGISQPCLYFSFYSIRTAIKGSVVPSAFEERQPGCQGSLEQARCLPRGIPFRTAYIFACPPRWRNEIVRTYIAISTPTPECQNKIRCGSQRGSGYGIIDESSWGRWVLYCCAQVSSEV